MRGRVDPVGKVLLRSGALSEEALADALDQQRQTLPLASLCYVLGYVDEESLVRALSRQFGVPGLVLDRCVIQLAVLESIPHDVAIRHNVLPVYEDDRRIFIAARNPREVTDILREIQFVRGKILIPHIALHVTLARTLRACYAAKERGEPFVSGPLARPGEGGPLGKMTVVSDTSDLQTPSPERLAVVEDVTKELDPLDLLIDAEDTTGVAGAGVTKERWPVEFHQGAAASVVTTVTEGVQAVSSVRTVGIGDGDVIDLDSSDDMNATLPTDHAGPSRILIVDDDFATRHLLVKTFQPRGFVTSTASSGSEAVRMLQNNPPDLVIIDVMLPEIDGFQVCRSIKQSAKYNHIGVILMSAVIDSGRVTDDVLRRYGADAYLEKPLDMGFLIQRASELLRGSTAGLTDETPAVPVDDGSFQRAIDLYKQGDLDRAIEALRGGLEVDPLSAKHHFVLANLLQKKSQYYEAIDEYEATVDLKPDYFPALTRLAYLYYKQGFSARAIEMWRRSLPHCTDSNLRENIEVFMRKLIADMQSEL